VRDKDAIGETAFTVLSALEPTSLGIGEIAAELGLAVDSVARALARLEDAGLVQRLGERPVRFAPSPPGLDLIIESAAARAPRAPELTTITPYRDGPLLVRGAFRLVDQDGREIDAQRSTIALCRCGKSKLRPLCDGSHKQAGFRAPSGAEDRSRPTRPA
jgi:CDGSH-type Zn-finger protein